MQGISHLTCPKLALSSGLNLMNFYHHSLSQMMTPPPITSRNLEVILTLLSSHSPHPILAVCLKALEVLPFSPFTPPPFVEPPLIPAWTTTRASQLASPIDSIPTPFPPHPHQSILEKSVPNDSCCSWLVSWAASGLYVLSSSTWQQPLPVLTYCAIL